MTRNGREVVVPSVGDYGRLAGPESLIEFLRDAPLADVLKEGELELERPRDSGCDLEL